MKLQVFIQEINWVAMSFIAGCALFWLFYFDLKDRLQPEPKKYLFLGFILGCLTGQVCLKFFLLLDLYSSWKLSMIGESTLETAKYCFLVIGPVEEGVKFCMLWLILSRIKDFDEQIDGMVYAATIGVGFASTESFLDFGLSSIELTPGEMLFPALTRPLTHSLFAAVWGFGVGYANFTAEGRKQKALWYIGPLLLSMVLHGLYDFALFGLNQPIITSALALGLWVPLIYWAGKIVHTAHPKIPNDTQPSA